MNEDYGCSYCKMEDDGCISEDRIDVFRFRMGSLGKDNISVNGMIVDDELYIFTQLQDYEVSGESFNINYCPICGRRLKREDC